MINIETVNEYLSLHIQSDFWDSISQENKEKYFNQANDDVCSYLGISEINTLRIFQLCAVSEQSIFLALDKSDDTLSHRALVFMERESECINIIHDKRNDDNTIKGVR